MIEMLDSFQKIDVSQIAELEKSLHAELPQDYRSFLLIHNGGRPKKSVFIYMNGTSEELGCINRFLGIHDGAFDNLYKSIETYKSFQKRLPENLLPIACDPGGNLICLSLFGNDIGNIYFWDHDWEAEEDEEPNYDNVHPIALSFIEFIDTLILDE
jgi:cell wall assembly regulator SMI1